MSMKPTGLFAVAILCLASALARPAAQDRTAQPAAAPAVDPKAFVGRYCATCHSQRTQAGGLQLDAFDPHQFSAGTAADLGEKMIRRLRARTMPPQGAPQPDVAAQQAFASWLEGELDAAERAHPNPGRSRLRRLNRAEYGNAVRDLLALDVDPSTLVPPDNASFGFDNVADVRLSPTLQERYLASADRVSALAVGDPALEPEARTYTIRQDVSQDQHIDGLPLGTLGGALIRHTFPLDGDYELQVKLYRSNLGMMRGMQLAHPFELAIDGTPVRSATVGGPADLAAAFAQPTDAGDAIDARLSTRVHVGAGTREVMLAFTDTAAALDTVRLRPFLKSAQDTLDWTGRPHIQSLTIKGPFAAAAGRDTPSRRRVFACRPAQVSAETACASRILSTMLRRAYRQPVEPADLDRAMRMYAMGRAEGTFETGIQRAVQFVLASPKFTFRPERLSAPAAGAAVAPLSPTDLASQLSFFLWSSLPDEALLDAATTGTLRAPRVLDAQVRRLLADRRSSALVENFAGQWLQLRNVRSLLPNSDAFPDFDDNLRQSLRRETELLVESVIREDRSVLDLLTADYTFVNERLARHYGIPGVYGSEFRRVPVRDEARRGLLGQGSILALTSHATRTSPVLRGKWVLENILGTPPPPPPPNVPTLKEPGKGDKPRSMREQLAEHRATPTCASCHKVMDPIGFALENFDAVGAWRSREGGAPIDVSGQLADGAVVDGVGGLRQALLARPDVFVGTMVEKLMIYALGRGLTSHDMPAVRQVVREARAQDYRFSAIVLAVTRSVPFQFRLAAANTTLQAAR
jgi:hypothetical protein